MSVVKTCTDLETIMNLKEINDVEFNSDQTIFLFDELDIGLNEAFNKEKSNDTIIEVVTDKKVKPIDNTSLNIGYLLSKFDGVTNYNGKIIVATTNNKESLNPALYREMRLTPLYFTYSRKEDIEGIISKFFGKRPALNFCPTITPARVTFLCEKYEHLNIEEFIEILRKE